MNAHMARLLPICLLAGACSATTVQQKEAAIQVGLETAFVACAAGLNDPRVTWAPGARDYCLRVVNAEPECAQ
jgi:hypothetical protein